MGDFGAVSEKVSDWEEAKAAVLRIWMMRTVHGKAAKMKRAAPKSGPHRCKNVDIDETCYFFPRPTSKGDRPATLLVGPGRPDAAKGSVICT